MEIMEVWVDVPETNGQYQISNCGHIRLMFRKDKSHRRGGEKPPLFVGEPRMLFCDFETERFGWFVRDVRSERKWRFVGRDETMALFEANGIPVNVDKSGDEEARRRMDEANARQIAETAQTDAAPPGGEADA